MNSATTTDKKLFRYINSSVSQRNDTPYLKLYDRP